MTHALPAVNGRLFEAETLTCELSSTFLVIFSLRIEPIFSDQSQTGQYFVRTISVGLVSSLAGGGCAPDDLGGTAPDSYPTFQVFYL